MKPKPCLGCGQLVESYNSVYTKMMSLMHRGFIIPLFTLRWHELCWVDKCSEIHAKHAAEEALEERAEEEKGAAKE